MAIQLTHYGHAGFKLVTASGQVVLIDPWLKNPGWDGGEKELQALDRVDLICLTHGHSDHVGESVEIAKKTKAKLVANFDLAAAMRTALGYPADLANSELIGGFGGEVRAGEITFRFIPAWHGSFVAPKENAAPVYSGTPSGIVLSVSGGPTIYHTGDTDLFSDMALVPLEEPIDWMLVCIGGQYTMGPARAARAVELVKPKFVVPIHFGTFPVLAGTPEQFGAEMKKRGVTAEMRVMKAGETIPL
ncbi:MAG: metal-dependent hydrolase [Verrucomicrobiota bacterium]|nr:metal-dependent hydrolase [Verrucomicrobiota bacterium]